MDQIELAGTTKELGNVQRAKDVAVEGWIFIQTDRDNRNQLPIEMGIARGEERDVESAPAHPVGNVEGDLFPGPVARRRRRPRNRAEHREPYAFQLHC